MDHVGGSILLEARLCLVPLNGGTFLTSEGFEAWKGCFVQGMVKSGMGFREDEGGKVLNHKYRMVQNKITGLGKRVVPRFGVFFFR